MIVADTNIIAYLLIPGDKTALAKQLLMADAEWHAPMLWRSELRNVLALYMRQRSMSLAEATGIVDMAEALMRGNEHRVSSGLVLDLVSTSGASAYDCEFVALAQILKCPMISADRKLLRYFPEAASSMARYLEPSGL